ncbi:hypothetical protein I79_014164 [Cricetulus griseus]|uniref:Uncharacterized protein n=1 Tax=Cricetulus griseus TaxID=10029 RepID=G3HTD9_CRIGR|nr:hypothetical protein I79_014164 [Cricetulus griseus]
MNSTQRSDSAEGGGGARGGEGRDQGQQEPRDPLRPWSWPTTDGATRSSDSKAQICPAA